MKSKTHYSVVIPVYNEKESLKELFDQNESFFAARKESVEYICIDDGSTDGSFEELCRIKKNIHSSMVLIKFRKNLGKSAALSV